MRKLAMLAAAAFLGGSALAQQPPEPETWAYLKLGDGTLGWNLHAGRWSRNNEVAEGRRILHYSPPIMADGQEITWAQDDWKIDCTANTIQIKSGEELNASLVTVFTLTGGQPVEIKPGTTAAVLKTVYCENMEIEGVQFAQGLLGLMEAVTAAAPAAAPKP